eukprot:CAMPEP_0194136926 /NCGR_PEP_ID=MMETSP0152-20130528/6858_1 /TAXON_ID=1049557 /ORGANISM="Thalassiothrix antarctica, Strain L6-D1" /LENGTH=599 /DNA_ID=CAMNT_0038833743 /DNA_START=355 /DNA_END=2154 /DNA_ORIENTATION=-
MVLVWIDTLWNFPVWYKDWWFDLVLRDPIHVLVETTLLSFVLYMMIVSRNKDYKFRKEQKLSSKEQEELIHEWKINGRASLAPSMTFDSTSAAGEGEESIWAINSSTTSNDIVVSSMKGRTMEIVLSSSTMIQNNDSKKKKNNKRAQSNNNNNRISRSFSRTKNIPTAEIIMEEEKKMTVLNFATNDFLGLGSSLEIKEASVKALNKYGCGSCGPRGFYGTIDVHLELEQQMANFVRTEQAILYSDGASTISSTIAAFCKRGDLVIVDSAVYEPILTGVTLSRANVIWFQHNDMDDLRRVLLQVQKKDHELGRKPNDQRRFIVAEALYKNSGTICPLAELVELKHEFKYRLILDETHSFGTLAPRGLLEFSKKRYMYDADIVTIGLETTLGAIGGITVGNEEIVDHQRLSGAGYCFSASSPPFTATAAMAALAQLERSTANATNKSKDDDDEDNASSLSLSEQLQTNLATFHEQFQQSKILLMHLLRTSDDRSPLVYLELQNIQKVDDNEIDLEIIAQRISHHCLMESAVAIVGTTPTRRNHGHNNNDVDNTQLFYPPAIRVALSAHHTNQDIQKVVSALEQACQSIIIFSTTTTSSNS